MDTDKILQGITQLNLFGARPAEIKGISDDSRKIQMGFVFFAIKGLTSDGHIYIQKAIEKGATVIVFDSSEWEKTFQVFMAEKSKSVLFCKTDVSRKALAIAAGNYYDNPAKSLKLIGITGTNGKTTTCSFIYQLMVNEGFSMGLISTIAAHFGTKTIYTGFHVTNPEPIELHSCLRRMVDANCEYVVIEVTSHGLDQYRVFGCDFEVCGVTNITPEHLDYHKTMAKYITTKAQIFDQSSNIVLNKYDPSIKQLLRKVPKQIIPVISDYTLLKAPQQFSTNFPGVYNLQNAQLAIDVLHTININIKPKSLANLKSVSGRYEYVYHGDFDIVIDFAHDASAVKNVLNVARSQTSGKIIHVFGCAGLRDHKKRPVMGMLSRQLADITIITAEDPRTELLDVINKSIIKGIKKAGGKLNLNYFVIPDRQDAINFAVQKLATKNDLVILTGKGHEKSMCFGNTEVPWSDHDAVYRALSNKPI